VYARQMFVCKVRRLLSQFSYLEDANLRNYVIKHPGMVLYFSSPQQQQQHHTHGCQISTLLYTIINEALVPIKQSACGPRRPPGLVLLPKQVL